MISDSLAVARMALADFGEEVTVVPLSGEPFVTRMIWGEAGEDTTLGSARGAMSRTAFRCAPEIAEQIAEGDHIETADGADFAVFEVFPRRGMLTEIRVVER